MTDPCSEKIFDSLLEEMLTDQHPPDLVQRIQQRFREEQNQNTPARADSDSRLHSTSPRGLASHASAPQAPAAQLVTATPVSAGSVTSRSASSTKELPWHAAIIAIVSLAAGLLIAIGVWQLVRRGPSNAPDQASGLTGGLAAHDADGTSSSDAARTTAQTDASRENALADKAKPEKAGGASTRAREQIALDRLPFDTGPSADQSPTSPRTPPSLAGQSPIAVAAAAKPWADAEIVAWVDDRFNQLWQREQVQPSQFLADEALARRVAQVLAGDQQALSSPSPRELTDRLLQSGTFAEHWADRIVAYWLRGTAAANANDKDGAALRANLAQQIVARKPWNEVVASLIGSQPDSSEAAFLSTLAGGNNHRLASRVGSVVLDEALGCARCHDASDNGRVISTDQDEYWSLVAIFTGLDSQTAPGNNRRRLVDRQPQLFADGKAPNVFFDRPDGRLQAAGYRLPDGDNWRTLADVETPRQGLAKWIASTPVSDAAAVNLAWRLVFGRPLVAQHAALDGVGLAERREILQSLAAQFQAHGRDMSQLVGWLVSTRPFAAQELAVDRQAWLLASDDQITKWNLATTNFASFTRPSAPKPQFASLDRALASVVRWSDTGDQRRATLAQPNIDVKGSQGRGAAQAAAADEPTPTYLVRSLGPTAAQRELIDRLVASHLSWPQQVEHIAGLVGEAGNDARLKRLADQLLKSKNGDRAAALFQLLQCAQLCDETF